MQLNKYQQLSRRTQNSSHEWSLTVANASMGLIGETIELLEQVRDTPLDTNEVTSEMGDVLFYASWLADLFQTDLEQLSDEGERTALDVTHEAILHAGRITEAGKKLAFHGRERTRETDKTITGNLIPILAYLHYIAASIDTTLNDIAAANIEKLKARYPNGFTPNSTR